MRAELRRFHAGTLEERWLAARGTLVAWISVDGIALRLANVHTTAGGLLRHPEAGAVDALRGRQIAEARAALDGDGAAILAGDFNCGPGASFANYQAMLDAGWIDCSAAASDFGEPTWDPGNPLNRGGPHRTSPAQRIDHVLARRADVETGRVRPLASRVVLREPRVAIGPGKAVPLSDHYGVQVELELAP
jgi:endonuclease/exonuclease/phosphatase family metal-dependent hydrolase